MELKKLGFLFVCLFGHFRMATHEDEEINISNRRGRAILAMLCVHPGQPLEREQISKLLWPRRFKTQARASLRQCLHELNRQLQTLGLDILELSRTRIAIKKDAVRTDLQTLEAALTENDHDKVIELIASLAGKPLLDDIDLGDAVDAWLAAQRLQFESRLRVAVQKMLSALNVSGNRKSHDELSQVWRDCDWYRNERSFLPTRCGVAVLPFQQIDELGGDFFLAAGAVDELSSRLSALEAITLAGRTSVDALVEHGLSLSEMASKLGVNYLVEGTAHRSAETVSLSIRLIEANSGQSVWSERIEGTAQNFIGSRQVIGANIIAGLCGALGVAANVSNVRRMTANRDAYALYLQGRALIQRSMTEGAVAKAIELLQQSLALDSDFAECWTALAEAHIHTAVYTPCLDRIARSEQAAQCARRARELDSGQGYALSILGIHEWTCFNPTRALEYALEAYRLEPHNADVTVRLGSFLLYLGRTREALLYIEAAVEQDPVNGRNYVMLCVAQLNLGNVDAAIKAGQRMVDLGLPSMWLGVATAASGNHELAVEQYRETRHLMNKVIFPPAGTKPLTGTALKVFWEIAARGVCSGRAIHRKAYCAMLDYLYKTLPDSSDTSIVAPAIWMGYSEMVFKTLGQQITPANMYCLMSLWADIEPIRQTRLHPGFMNFAEQIGMVSAWEKYGWPDLMPTDPRKN